MRFRNKEATANTSLNEKLCGINSTPVHISVYGMLHNILICFNEQCKSKPSLGYDYLNLNPHWAIITLAYASVDPNYNM